MPQIILGPSFGKIDGSMQKLVFSFLAKLQVSEENKSLHIEKINGSADGRIRTGRLNESWRAVLVRFQVAAGDTYFIYLGTFPHDDAIAFAKSVVVRVNPRNMLAELVTADRAYAATSAPDGVNGAKPKPDDVDTTTYPLLETQGISLEDLLGLGIDEPFASRALLADTDDAILALAEAAPAAWQSDAILELATGGGMQNVRERLGLAAASDGEDLESDESLLEALRHPASRMDFAFIEDDDELRAAIEDGDFARWRVFLHPEQREYAFKKRSGSFRLSGGAGTGKTVVLLHRARHLARQDPQARIILTTFNKTLAGLLAENLRQLDAKVPIATELGEPGVYIAGVDAVGRRVLVKGEARIASAVTAVLGQRPPNVIDSTSHARWAAALATAGAGLDAELRSATFLATEYGCVVLPGRITSHDDYLRVRRPGRGVALSRAQRTAVWEVVEAYRASSATAGSSDWDEKAMIAATHLDLRAADGDGRVADHVLVDEAQDLAPTRLHLLRSLVNPGPDDLFIAEDSQQRIYGQRAVLSRYGINVRGRSRRMTLNYRTTAQVLRYAVGVLEGETWIDLEAENASTVGYRSARSGPVPRELVAATATDEHDQLAAQLSGWIEAGDNAAALGVLVRTKAAAERVVRELGSRGIRAVFVQDNVVSGETAVQVMTMHRSKGMEFKRAVLFGVSSAGGGWGAGAAELPEAERAEAELRERSLLYVAATRARDELVVLWNGERSELLPAAGLSS